MGDFFSATSLAAGHACSSPEAGEVAKAVSHFTPWCVASGGMSSAAVTQSILLGTLQIGGLGRQVTNTNREKVYDREHKGLLCQSEI